MGQTRGIHGQLEAQKESAKPAARQQRRKYEYRRSNMATGCKEAQLELPQPWDETVPPADRQIPGISPAIDPLHPSSSPAPGPGSRPLKVVTCNLMGLTSTRNELSRTLQIEQPDIIIFTETKLVEEHGRPFVRSLFQDLRGDNQYKLLLFICGSRFG